MPQTFSVDLPPKADMLIESMRDIGYTLESALADIVDNAIAAGARNIQVRADTTGSRLAIGIADDGLGMSEEELRSAMQLGSRHPGQVRSAGDLGRFGLGLKTASFSQCRRLTVVSRSAGQTSVAVWDLDHVAETQSWSLLLPRSIDGIPFVNLLGDRGCLVVWENLDRHMDLANPERQREHFIRRIDDSRIKLELVFHRYLSGLPGKPKLRIALNGRDLVPYDPFHSQHPATIRSEGETIQLGPLVVRVQAYTLPHHNKVSATDWERYGGSEGYVRNQGFYLYRQNRLILHGTWFGLARQTELTKLSRVSIDVPIELDAIWQIDIMKSTARPPGIFRERLKRIIDTLGAPSRRVYRHKGATTYDRRFSIWQRRQSAGNITYSIDWENPVIQQFSNQLPSETRDGLVQLLGTVSAALPVDAIFADLADTPEKVRGEILSDHQLRTALEVTAATLRSSGIPSEVIPQMLKTLEPFRSNWERASEMLGNGDQEA